MSTFLQFLKKTWILLWRRKFLNELDEEMEFHRAQAETEFLASGMTPRSAREAAIRQFGNVTKLKEQSQQAVAFRLETVAEDFRFAVRQLLRAPGFAITAVTTLALGIAANVIVFGVLQALVLRPLDIPHPGNVVSLQPKNETNYSHLEFRDIRDGQSVFSAVAADRLIDLGLDANGATHPIWGYEVSGQYFEVVSIKPLLGRLLTRADDDHPGAAEVAVLSWDAWKNYFHGDPAIVGKVVRLNKLPYTVIGVTPQSFYGTEKFIQPQVFFPMSNEAEIEKFNWLEGRQNHNIWVIARIREGISLSQVQADLNTVASRITKQFPKEEAGLSIRVLRPGLLGDTFGAPARAFLAGIMALAAIVLLATCANLGGLFAARTADRARELAIRMAIGSSRIRILRQVLSEALLLALFAGLAASALGWAALSGLGAWRPATSLPIQFAVRPQPSLIVAAGLFSFVAAVLFGMMPLRQILKANPNDAIKSGVGPSSAGRRWALRDVLLAAQIALCCITVTAAFVALRGLGKSLNMQLGFQPVNAVRVQFDLAQAGYSNETAASFQHRLLAAASQLQGVEAIGYANTTPLAIDQSGMAVFSPETTDMRPTNIAFGANDYSVSPGYFATAGTQLVSGRDISSADTQKSPPVAIVNQEFARRLFHADQVIGRYFKTLSGRPIQIVGIVADGKYDTLNEDPKPAIFFPIAQEGNTSTTLIVRIHPDPTGVTGRDMAAAIRKTILDLDPAIPIQESSAWSSQLSLQLFPAQAATVALSLFGAFGLLLSITGTFGLASYSVTKRLRELSIRIALGAQARQVLAAALGRMLVFLSIGSLLGLILGAAGSRLLSAVVYQASALDPIVLCAVAFTMLLTGLVSIVNPVRRALHIDPAGILREQ
jgi:predicted permease